MQMPKTETDVAPKPRGRPRDPERSRRILDAASSHFYAHGLERASVDAIAAEAASRR
jgi:AcrR family transcriptional regulator